MRFKLLHAAFVAALSVLPTASLAAQATYALPTAGPMSLGTLMSSYVNPALAAVLSNNSGSSAPAVSGQPAAYQFWVDTSGSPKLLKVYDGANWLTIGSIDASGHVWTPSNALTSGNIGSTVEAWDTDLDCLAALTTAADKFPYFTGSHSCAVGDVTSFARTILDDADAAAVRTTIGLVIGTNVEAHDADLTSWAAVTRGSGFDTFAATATSANERALLSDETGNGADVFQNGDLGTPSAAVATNFTGTAPGLTAGTVTTNANLTGPITSVGNATSVASQTGTGSKFVMDTNPTISGPTLSGVANASGAMKLSTESAPSQITADQNDYNPASVICASSATLLINSDAARNITGLGGGAAGCLLYVVNTGSFTITLKDENASSSAANRFGFGADLALVSKSAATLKYDGTNSRWRAVGGPPGSGGGGGSGTVTSVVAGTGLSGGTITTSGTISLDVTHANSWSGVQTFGDGDVVLSGATSGSSTLKAPATGGGPVTLPAGTRTLASLDGPETLTSKTLTSPVLNTGVSGTALAADSDALAATSTSLLLKPSNLAAERLLHVTADNLGFSASVSSNALTVTMLGANGSAISATNPVTVPFRNATAATGTPSNLTVTSAQSIVISSGSTMGFTSGVIGRLWIVGFNDAGTFRLGLVNALSGTSIMYLRDGIFSSTAEGGAGAADSAQVIYTGTAVTSKAMKVLGYLEATEATAGTWATTPSLLQIWGPGLPLPGDVVQVAQNSSGAVATGTTTLPEDNTTPQNSEGVQFLTQAITPVSAADVLLVEHEGQYASSNTTNSLIGIALFQDSTANALAAAPGSRGGGTVTNSGTTSYLRYRMLSGTTSSTTFKIRAGTGSAGTTTFNGVAGGGVYNGTVVSFLSVTEIMG